MRWGGGLLAVGALLGLVAYSIQFVSTEPVAGDDSASERAAKLAEASEALRASSLIAVFSDAAAAVAGLFLLARPYHGRSRLPVSAFWAPFALGELLFVFTDGGLGYGLVPLAGDYVGNEGAFLAAEGTLDLLLGLSVFVFSLAALALFWGEWRSAGRDLPRWLAGVGLVGSAAVWVASLGPLFGIVALQFFFIAFFLVAVPFLVLGLRVAFPRRAAGPA